MTDESPDAICGTCNSSEHFSAPVSVILLFALGLDEPYPMIPKEHYRICKGENCQKATVTFMDRAQASLPTTKNAGAWTRGIIVFADGTIREASKPKLLGRVTARA